MKQYMTTPVVVACGSNTTKTVLAYQAPSTHGALLKKIGISFDGADASKTPVRVDLLRQTTAGTATTGGLSEVDANGDAGLGVVKYNHSAEPTSGDILDSWYVTPAGGLWVFQWPLGDEIILAPSGYVALRCVTVTASGTPNCAPTMTIVE